MHDVPVADLTVQALAELSERISDRLGDCVVGLSGRFPCAIADVRGLDRSLVDWSLVDGCCVLGHLLDGCVRRNRVGVRVR